MTSPLGPTPSLNALRAFEAASRHLNFRLAGLELGVTQGAVAQQIRALEAELGLKLFERHPRTLVLTHNGQRYATNVRRAFEMLADATQGLRPEPLHVTVSVTPTFATKWLIPRLADYTRLHPGVDLRILATERLSHFQTEAVDLAVRYGRPHSARGSRPISCSKSAWWRWAARCCCAAPGHPAPQVTSAATCCCTTPSLHGPTTLRSTRRPLPGLQIPHRRPSGSTRRH